MPKTFQLPEPIRFRNPTTKEPLEAEGAVCSFRRCLTDSLLNVPGVWSGHRGMRAANKIEDAVEAAEKGDGTVVLDSEHYELLKKAAESEDALVGAWSAPLARQLLPHIDAILEAVDFVPALATVPATPPAPVRRKG